MSRSWLISTEALSEYTSFGNPIKRELSLKKTSANFLAIEIQSFGLQLRKCSLLTGTK